MHMNAFNSRRTFLLAPAACLLLAPALATPSRADGLTVPPVAEPSGRLRAAKVASDSLLPILALGELALLSDNRDGKRYALRGAGAVATTFAATVALKKLFGRKRLTRDDRDAFPSGHASLSFAMASTLGTIKPSYAVPSYGAATAISLSRIELREHRWDEVVVGGALGFLIGRAFARGAVRGGPATASRAVSLGFSW
jgi:membrane-associated phospholipid phosphatase